ncbi:hypothetical protein AX17_003932, partial [Amanita inopinata Kibby_2008]
MAPFVSRKRRKLSDMTIDDTNVLLSALVTLRPREAPEKRTTFSKIDLSTLGKVKITIRLLTLRTDKTEEIEALGRAGVKETFLTFDATAELIRLVRSHVSLVTGTGCRMLISIVLLRLSSTMQSAAVELNILPEFPVPKTIFDDIAPEGTRSSFSGVLNYLLASVPPPLLIQYPSSTISELKHKSVTPVIIEEEQEKLRDALPQAAVASASYCKQHQLPLVRGFITSGEEWLFFVYKASDDELGRVVFVHDRVVSLGAGLESLPLVLGLLRDL